MYNTTEEVEIIEVDGETLYLMPSGKIYPIVSGAATNEEDDDSDNEDDEDESGNDDDGNDDDGDGDEDDEDGEEEEEKLLTPDQVRRIASREKKDGRRTGRAAVLKELGFESIEAAKAALKKAPKKNSKADTDEESEQEDNQADLERERKLMRIHGRAERKLIAAGAPDKDSVLAGLIVMLDLEDDADPDDITTAVEDLKAENPALFGGTKKVKKTSPRHSDPGRRNGGRTVNKDAASNLFSARHGKK